MSTDDASGGLDVIGPGDHIEKALAVSLELYWPDSADVLKGAEGARATQGKFSKRPIREYNIRRHVFLARDGGAHGLEAGEQALLTIAELKIVAGLSDCSRRRRPAA